MTTAQQFERRRWIALALLAMAQFVVVLDASIVNVALPTIGESLSFSADNLSWVVNAYVLRSEGSCCSAAGSPTCSAGAACSWAASSSSRSPRSRAASPSPTAS